MVSGLLRGTEDGRVNPYTILLVSGVFPLSSKTDGLEDMTVSQGRIHVHLCLVVSMCWFSI